MISDFKWNKMKTDILAMDSVNYHSEDTMMPAPNKRKVMEVCLENTRRELGHVDDEKFRIIIEVLKRVVPNLAAHSLVNVQPLYDRSDIIDVPRMMCTGEIDIDRQFVTARKRRFSARIAMEEMNRDTNYLMYNQILDALAQEIIAEQDQELLGRMNAISPRIIHTFDMGGYNQPAPLFGTPQSFDFMIQNMADVIKLKTNREQSISIVISPTVLSILQTLKSNGYFKNGVDFVRKESKNLFLSNTTFVGYLYPYGKVYVDQYAADSKPILVLLNGEQGSGLTYCPYLPVVLGDEVIDPHYLGESAKVTLFHAEQTFYEMPAMPLLCTEKSSYFYKRIGVETHSFCDPWNDWDDWDYKEFY